jgi:hypothetical protein
VRFVVDKVALGQVLSEYFGSPANLHSIITPQSPTSAIWGWYNRLEVTAVQGTQSHPTNFVKSKLFFQIYDSKDKLKHEEKYKWG